MSAQPTQMSEGSRRTARDPKQIAALVSLVLVAAWLVAFIVSNSETVKVSFVFGDASVALIWVMIICAVLGGGLVFALPRLLRRRAKG